MGIKISEYANTATALSASDLTDISKLISTGPDVWQTQKLPYSVLLTELTADLNFVEGSGTLNYIPRFTAAGTIADGSIRDNLSQIGVGAGFEINSYTYIENTAYVYGLNVNNASTSSGFGKYGIIGQSLMSNTVFSNIGIFGSALNSTGGTNLGIRGLAASQSIQTSNSIIGAEANAGGFFQANTASTTVEAYGVVGSADATGLQAGTTYIGGYFRAKWGATNYAIRLQDGSEAAGKFLKSIDAFGRANWATVNDYTADATPDSAADYFLTWDTSAGLHKKVLMSNVPSSAVTLYNSNSTFTAARTAKLSGNTSSDFLTFQTLAGVDILKIKGDKSVDHYGNYSNGSLGDNYYRTGGASTFMNINYANEVLEFKSDIGTVNASIQSVGASNRGYINLYGNGSNFIMTAKDYPTAIINYVYGYTSGTTYTNYLNAIKAEISCSGFISVGAASTLTYALEVTGAIMQKTGNVGLYGATPTAQYTPVAADGIVHIGGAAVGSNDTCTGSIGTSAYTWGDVVAALKKIGILAQ